MANGLKVCYERILQKDVTTLAQPSMSIATRLALFRAKKWPIGSTLQVRFLDGNSSMHNIVKQFAPKWGNHANLKFDFNNATDAEIRITFNDRDGAWSYIGTDCKTIQLDQPTMNLGWQDEGVVLHEFGHAIGLIHEHQNPLGGIKWNKPNVIRDLSGPPNYWDPATIENNMFQKYSVDQLNGTALDKKSIMLYAIPPTWTLDGFQSAPNEVLSEVDKTFIGDPVNYPFEDRGATELPVIETQSTEASIGKPGEQDLFKFTAKTAGRYTIETEGPTDMVMSLYGPERQTNLITQDDDSGTDRNAKIVTELTPGTYYVQVRHYNSTGGTGSYRIKVSK